MQCRHYRENKLTFPLDIICDVLYWPLRKRANCVPKKQNWSEIKPRLVKFGFDWYSIYLIHYSKVYRNKKRKCHLNVLKHCHLNLQYLANSMHLPAPCKKTSDGDFLLLIVKGRRGERGFSKNLRWS